MKLKLFLLLTALLTIAPLAAQQVTLRGTVYDGSTGNPVEYAELIFVDARVRAQTDDNGAYAVSLPRGQHRVVVNSPGLAQLTTMVMAGNASNTFNITLSPVSISGGSLVIQGERKPQNISRRTMSFSEMEEVPATFGDAVSALATLPGINQAGTGQSQGSMFGPLVVRGVGTDHNRFFLDGIPIEYPQHFFGIHAVISSEFIREIDVYSSAYPALYNADYGSVIAMHSVDEVEKFGGYADFSLLSSALLVKTPIYGSSFFDGKANKQATGYLVVAGRVGYLTYTMPVVARELGTYIDPKTLPQYWDYQIKFRHNFDTRNSLTLLAVGSRDNAGYEGDDDNPEEYDPLYGQIELVMDQQFFTQGVTYTYRDSKIKNSVTAYAAIPYYYARQSLLHPLIDEDLKEARILSKPMTYTLKDEFSLEWLKNIATLGLGLEYNTHYFTSEGTSQRFREGAVLNPEDWMTSDLFERFSIDRKVINHTIGARMENRFTIGGLTLFPQVRLDYLDRSKATSIDPRLVVSYEFPTQTTISAASGKYHSFKQINPAFFNFEPEYAAYGEKMKPEQSIHNVVGMEQQIGNSYKFSVEGYYNYFYDLLVPWAYTHEGDYYPEKNEAEMKNYGFELMAQKLSEKTINGLFGWVSYTWAQSKYKTHLPLSLDTSGNGSKWKTSDMELEHVVKLVGGYRHKAHTFAGKFTWCSTLPYTEIVGGSEDTAFGEYEKSQGRDGRRVVPIYSDNVNAKHLPAYHQLDLRYSYQSNYEWGYVKWYLEAINVTQKFQKENSYTWNWQKDYESGTNPEKKSKKPSAGGLPFFPNMGVEIKF